MCQWYVIIWCKLLWQFAYKKQLKIKHDNRMSILHQLPTISGRLHKVNVRGSMSNTTACP